MPKGKKIDPLWETLFKDYNILTRVSNDGYFQITANQIKRIYEPRLMTKFDHSINLPEIFKTNGLSILPDSRGTYIISDFVNYQPFVKEVKEIEYFDPPSYLESLDFDNITSEPQSLLCANAASLMNDFLGEHNLVPTVQGRMGSNDFTFNIATRKGPLKIDVRKSQLEIDGGYEGSNGLYLFEAKNHLADDFLIRQLYYPYRLWQSKVSKPVHPIFLTYSNGVFEFLQYDFQSIGEYNSLILSKSKKYIIRNSSLTSEWLLIKIESTKCVPEPEVPFPQADRFERVINLCEQLNQEGLLSIDEITTNYQFDQRQTDYYFNASKYLGLVEKHRIGGEVFISLTELGQKVRKMD